MGNITSVFKARVKFNMFICMIITGVAKFLGGTISTALSKIPFVGSAVGTVLSAPFKLLGALFIPCAAVFAAVCLVQAILRFLKKRKAEAASSREKSGNAAMEQKININIPGGGAASGNAVNNLGDTERIDSFD